MSKRTERARRTREEITERGRGVLGDITEPPTRVIRSYFLWNVACFAFQFGFRFLHFFPSLSGMLLKRASEQRRTRFSSGIYKIIQRRSYFLFGLMGGQGSVGGCVAKKVSSGVGSREWNGMGRKGRRLEICAECHSFGACNIIA